MSDYQLYLDEYSQIKGGAGWLLPATIGSGLAVLYLYASYINKPIKVEEKGGANYKWIIDVGGNAWETGKAVFKDTQDKVYDVTGKLLGPMSDWSDKLAKMYESGSQQATNIMKKIQSGELQGLIMSQVQDIYRQTKALMGTKGGLDQMMFGGAIIPLNEFDGGAGVADVVKVVYKTLNITAPEVKKLAIKAQPHIAKFGVKALNISKNMGKATWKWANSKEGQEIIGMIGAAMGAAAITAVDSLIENDENASEQKKAEVAKKAAKKAGLAALDKLDEEKIANIGEAYLDRIETKIRTGQLDEVALAKPLALPPTLPPGRPTALPPITTLSAKPVEKVEAPPPLSRDNCRDYGTRYNCVDAVDAAGAKCVWDGNQCGYALPPQPPSADLPPPLPVRTEPLPAIRPLSSPSLAAQLQQVELKTTPPPSPKAAPKSTLEASLAKQIEARRGLMGYEKGGGLAWASGNPFGFSGGKYRNMPSMDEMQQLQALGQKYEMSSAMQAGKYRRRRRRRKRSTKKKSRRRRTKGRRRRKRSTKRKPRRRRKRSTKKKSRRRRKRLSSTKIKKKSLKRRN